MVLAALGAAAQGCPRDCPPGSILLNGECTLEPPDVEPVECPLDCTVALAAGVAKAEARLSGNLCFCAPTECEPNYDLDTDLHVCRSAEIQCPEGFMLEGFSCVWQEDIYCYENPRVAHCIPLSCEEYPTANDGTDLTQTGQCIVQPLGRPPEESCVTGCHNGIEDPHPWFGGADLSCTGCHGGDPEATSRETAHVAIPAVWQANSTQWGRPNLRYYFNYLTLSGVENFDGGTEWLRFRNPSDLRVAEMSCGKSGCHDTKVEAVKRSVMATGLGLVGVAQARNGIARTVHRDGDAIYKWDTTEGMTGGSGTLRALNQSDEYVGSVDTITEFRIFDREQNGAYDQIDILKEIYDKQCGDCHLNSAGANNRYADFRSSGCASCHMRYDLNGRSNSNDQMIKKDEPTYPAAWAQIANYDANDLQNVNGNFLGAERPHPARHTLTRQMASQRCGVCHVGSNRTDWQFRGYQIDPNRTAVAAVAEGTLNNVQFTDEIDNNANPFARYHGQAQDQVLKYVDWNNDNIDDIPADIHYQAGLECMDCHTGNEMHNELVFPKVAKVTDWNDPSQVTNMSGAIWSHQDQATQIECVHCHGNLEYRAPSFDIDNRNPIKNLIVCPENDENFEDYQVPSACANLGKGRFLKSKFSGRYHYVPQTRDTVNQVGNGGGGGPTWPGNGGIVFSENASIFHGRYNNDATDGVGPCPDLTGQNCFQDEANQEIPITQNFSHLGDRARNAVDQMEGGLECYACHATWANMCFGCHLRVADNDGNNRLQDFARSTGQLTIGQITEADFTYISPLDMQFGINSEGKFSQFLPETKQMVAHTDANNLQYFGTQVLVNEDPNIQYNAYRNRDGYGLRRYAEEVNVGLPPNSDGLVYEQFVEMDDNAGQGAQQMVPHSVQRSSPLMDCTNCHIDVDAANVEVVKARYMANQVGFANVSDYLIALDAVDIVRNNSNQTVDVRADLGFRFDAVTDPTAFVVDQQSDWCVNEETGFPYCYNNHPMKVGQDDVTIGVNYLREYPTMARIAGPMGPGFLTKMFNRITVQDRNVQLKGVRGR